MGTEMNTEMNQDYYQLKAYTAQRLLELDYSNLVPTPPCDGCSFEAKCRDKAISCATFESYINTGKRWVEKGREPTRTTFLYGRFRPNEPYEELVAKIPSLEQGVYKMKWDLKRLPAGEDKDDLAREYKALKVYKAECMRQIRLHERGLR